MPPSLAISNGLLRTTKDAEAPVGLAAIFSRHGIVLPSDTPLSSCMIWEGDNDTGRPPKIPITQKRQQPFCILPPRACPPRHVRVLHVAEQSFSPAVPLACRVIRLLPLSSGFLIW